MQKKPKILVILGPTATGKSDLAVRLAKKYNGEIISADSRQVYKGLDIGTGKITKKEMRGIKHYMLDVVSPKKVFSVSDWKKQAENNISTIVSKNKIPIICGGTGFYIKSLVENVVLPEVPANHALRKRLKNKTAEELFSILKKLDPRRAKNIDKNNSVRLIRAIEIAKKLGKVPSLDFGSTKNSYEFLQIGLKLPDKELKTKIHSRLFARIREGMIDEVRKLHKKELSWKRMRELGMEYRYVSEFLQNKISKEDLVTKLDNEIWHYAKRQMTWFKLDKRIKWFSPKDKNKIEREVAKFLKK